MPTPQGSLERLRTFPNGSLKGPRASPNDSQTNSYFLFYISFVFFVFLCKSLLVQTVPNTRFQIPFYVVMCNETPQHSVGRLFSFHEIPSTILEITAQSLKTQPWPGKLRNRAKATMPVASETQLSNPIARRLLCHV